MERVVYAKKLCMSELQVERYYYEGTQYFDASAGERYATLTFILKGYGRIRTVGDELQVEAGNLLYIPEGERYDAVWTGGPSIEYISFHIVSQKYDMENTDRYPAQIIHALSGDRTKLIFREIFRMFATEERLQKIHAMGVYYNFMRKFCRIWNPLRRFVTVQLCQMPSGISKSGMQIIFRWRNWQRTCLSVYSGCTIFSRKSFPRLRSNTGTNAGLNTPPRICVLLTYP